LRVEAAVRAVDPSRIAPRTQRSEQIPTVGRAIQVLLDVAFHRAQHGNQTAEPGAADPVAAAMADAGHPPVVLPTRACPARPALRRSRPPPHALLPAAAPRPRAARTIASALDNDLVQYENEFAALGATLAPALPANDPDTLREAMHRLSADWSLFHPCSDVCKTLLADTNGRVLWSEPSQSWVGSDLSQQSVWRDVFANQRALIVSQPASASNQRALVSMAVPIRSGERLLGFLVSEFPRTDLSAPLAPALNLTANNYQIELFDAAGNDILSNPQGKQSVGDAHLQLVAPLWQAHGDGVRTHSLPNNSGHVIAFAPLSQIAWGVIVEQRSDEGTHSVADSRRLMEVIAAALPPERELIRKYARTPV